LNIGIYFLAIVDRTVFLVDRLQDALCRVNQPSVHGCERLWNAQDCIEKCLLLVDICIVFLSNRLEWVAVVQDELSVCLMVTGEEVLETLGPLISYVLYLC
jgi:hypothetical protein